MSNKIREAVFHAEFIEDMKHWIATDRRTDARAFTMIESILREPFSGIGKPEPLTYLSRGAWSRRLTQENRIVYLFGNNRIDFLQARYHY